MACELTSADEGARIVDWDNVWITGPGASEVLPFAHGFGRDQIMYRRSPPRASVVVLQAQGHVPQANARDEIARSILAVLAER
ncbi:hypothetical protein QCD70_09415 [Agreia sp. PsM10]|uniref:hypothetical protein n=1 Tax=Agreia sp. PsM10 TaxID=3030533 RepID=UPI00263BA16D|nr:hypothetical protein [Agreia sp. PsM10]MDN4640460.1 hypothetical protein [Agreia sp. PsM10]